MTAVITSPADLANLALQRMGYKLRVGSLFDGSEAAQDILDVYGQTRDELLRQLAPEFAKRDIALTLLKSAPTTGYIPPTVWDPAANPPVPWRFEYFYPVDCLKVRVVKRTPLFVPNYDPQPTLFAIVNDNAYTPARRVIVANVPDALMSYVGQVTDPATWDVGFIEAFAATLARRIAPSLVGMDGTKLEMADEANETPKVDAQHG